MAENDQSCLRKLTLMRKQANWEIETERRQLFREVLLLVKDWTGQLPNLRDIFRTEEIDFLLSCAVDPNDKELEGLFIEFVISTGYKDEPDLEEDGKPPLHRTTPINHDITQHRFSGSDIFHKIKKIFDRFKNLFKIYDRFDVNYVGEDGYTHFHAACEFGVIEVVEKFLRLGQDPNCQSYFLPPLHLAMLGIVRDDTVVLLLRNGADPNLAGKNGVTPLHVIFQNNFFQSWGLRHFLKFCQKVGRPVRVDARDNLGRTPLHWAVANISPLSVDLLLDNGADLSQFTFPTVSHFVEQYSQFREDDQTLWHDISQLVGILEKRGYELDENAFLTIRALFIKYKLFRYSSSNFIHQSLRDEEFVREAKKFMWNSSLSLYDLIQLSPKQAAKVFTFTDYLKYTEKYSRLSDRFRRFCDEHLCEIVSRRFLPSRWAVYSFWELISYRLPIECCEMILEHLSSQDLFNIMVAVGDQSS